MAHNVKIRFGIANPTRTKLRHSYTGTCYVDGKYNSSKDLGFDINVLGASDLAYDSLAYWGNKIKKKFNIEVEFASKIELDGKFKKVATPRGKAIHTDNRFTLKNDSSLLRLLDDTIEEIGIMAVVEIMEVASSHVTSVHQKIGEELENKLKSDGFMAEAMFKVFLNTGINMSDKIIDKDILKIFDDLVSGKVLPVARGFEGQLEEAGFVDPESHKDVGFKPNQADN